MLHTDLTANVHRGLQRLGFGRAFGVQIAVWLLLIDLLVQSRLPDPDSSQLVYYLLLLCACGVGAAALLNAAGPASDAASETRTGSWSIPVWTWGAGGTAVICAAIGAKLAGSDEWNAQWWWLAAMGIPVLALLVARMLAWRSDRDAGVHVNWWLVGEAAALFLLAMIPRSINVTSSPPFLLGDEAQCGLFGRIFDAGHTPLLSISWYGLPMVSYAVSGVGLHLFGDSLTGLRLTNAVVGSIGVVLTYLLGKEWFSRRAGAIAGVFLAFTFLDLELGRDGIHYIQGPTSITLTLYLCTLWIKRGGAIPAVLAGMSLIVAVSVYWSARIVFFLVPLMLLFVFVQDRRLLLSRWREAVWMAIGLTCAGLPVAGLFQANPGSFNGHQGDVSIFSDAIDTKNHLISQYGNASKLSILLQQIWKVLAAFNSRGDASVIFGPWGKPILDTVSAALFPASLALALLRWRRWEYLTCLAWIAIVLGASAITIDPPLWGRFASVMPAVALLIGVLLAELWERFPRPAAWTSVVAAALMVVLGAIAVENLRAAFDEYPSVLRQTSMGPTDVGNFLSHAPGASQTVLLSDGSFYIDYEPIRFLAPNAFGCTLMSGQSLSECPLSQTSKLFVLLPGRVSDLAWLERQRPGGKVVTIGLLNNGAARILAYELG
jgi:hypothetical protein